MFIKRLLKEILRLLAGVIDYLIILLPIQFIMMGIFGVSDSQAQLFFISLFAVYQSLSTEYANQSIGKHFGKLRVVDVSGVKPALLYVGLRELVKGMYIVPILGTTMCLISIITMMVRKDGRALHDLVGNTKVIYAWQFEQNDE